MCAVDITPGWERMLEDARVGRGTFIHPPTHLLPTQLCTLPTHPLLQTAFFLCFLPTHPPTYLSIHTAEGVAGHEEEGEESWQIVFRTKHIGSALAWFSTRYKLHAQVRMWVGGMRDS